MKKKTFKKVFNYYINRETNLSKLLERKSRKAASFKSMPFHCFTAVKMKQQQLNS